MRTLNAYAIAAVVAVTTGLALKAARYTARPDLSEPAAIRHLVPHLAAAGWQTNGQRGSRAGDLYTWMEFHRAGCPAPLTLAFLGSSNEAAALVRLDHGGDVAFIQAGQVVAQPSGLHRQVSGLHASFRRLLGLAPPADLPLLALAPAPEPTTSDCRGPSAAEWRRIASTRSAELRFSPFKDSQRP